MKLNNLFEKILKEELLNSLFQPIVNIEQQTVYAYEALIRGPKDTALHGPLQLFDFANSAGQTAKLEFACRKQSIKQFASLNLPHRLFLNISPSVLIQPDFKKGKTLSTLQAYGLSPSNITIEITENHPTNNYKLLRDAVDHYRRMGFRIAMDDLGAGYSGLRLWSEVLPDYVKIDRHFIANIDSDLVKYNFVKSLQSMTKITNSRIIAEGVETQAEYLAIRSLGIGFAQGYYFEKPSTSPSRTIAIDKFQQASISTLETKQANANISKIIRRIKPISPHTNNNNVLKFFQSNPKVTMIPIVENDSIYGILYKDHFLTKLFASPYGLELHGDKKIKDFIDCTALKFDSNESIQSVSNQLTNSHKDYQAFIITHASKYLGLATVMELLEIITEQQLQSAKYSNPLTQLPGITPVNDLINDYLLAKKCFSAAYIDLDYFKPFNDVYGYEKGDLVIKTLSEILTQSVKANDGMVGHIGGDDFVVLFHNQDPTNTCQKVIESFELQVPKFYSKKELEQGGINAKNRSGTKTMLPLISLSIGIVKNTVLSRCDSHLEVADNLTDAKIQAKKIIGNSIYSIPPADLHEIAV